MELEPIGRAPQGEEPDLDPIVVPVVAYKTDGGEEIIERFPFKKVMPPLTLSYLIRNTGPNGEIPVSVALPVLYDCLDPDTRERWTEFLENPGHTILPDTVGQVLDSLVKLYTGGRPTRRRSSSASTGSRAKRTSTAARPSPA